MKNSLSRNTATLQPAWVWTVSKILRGHLKNLSVLGGMLLLPALLHADPLADVAAFSSLTKVDKAKLEKGEIVSSPCPGMSKVSRGQGVESLFLVDVPLEKAFESLKEWNGSGHSELKVYLHGDLSASPTAAEFKKLASAPGNDSVHALATATEKLASGSFGEFQVNSSEVKDAPGKSSDKGLSPEAVTFWSGLLEKRVHSYLSGGLPAQPPYTNPGKVSAADELAALLRTQPKIRDNFHSLLDMAGVSGKPSGKPSLYWELFDGEGTGAINLGASYFTPANGGGRAMDLNYYSTGSYYVMTTLYQVWAWPGPKPRTLIYRADLLSSAALGSLQGIEQKAAARACEKEIARLITYFQKDTAH